MIPKKYRKELDTIIERYRQGNATAEETRFIEDYYQSFESRPNISEQLTEEEKEQWKRSLLAKIHEGMTKREDAPVVPLYRRTVFKYVAAASIILVLGVGYLVFFNKNKVEGPQVTVSKTNDVPAPKETRAVITLANGQKVYLDSVGSGTIAQENNVNVVKNENGEIIYSHEGAKAQSELVYNTLNNPRGSKVINMTLSDGSHVWLNAGSSLTYPVAFAGNERKVEITGEAYFEVAHDASKPFIVSKGETSVTVLGTHFNVNAYDDEESLKVTLLEGSVKVSAASKVVTIKPGEQAQVNGGNAIGLVVNHVVDVDEVMAWKNGKFDFDGADLQAIMRQIARWYDVDVIYQGNVTKEAFKGEINRTVPVSKVLQMLEYLGVKFKIEGQKVTVMQ